MVYEYICPDCHVSFVSINVEPKKKCDTCGCLMIVEEWEGE